MPTVQAAARLILGAGGRIEAQGTSIIVLLPLRVSEVGEVEREARRPLHRASKVLYLASDTVVAELARDSRNPLADRLPDRHALAGGGVAES